MFFTMQQTSAATTERIHHEATPISIAAIDNGLAFPIKHPDAWRAC